jgi:hypothetical protein
VHSLSPSLASPLCCAVLQVNLSCNFFKGRFDVPRYIGFVDQYWAYLQAVEERVGVPGYRGKRGPAQYAAGGGSSSSGAQEENNNGAGGGSGGDEGLKEE